MSGKIGSGLKFEKKVRPQKRYSDAELRNMISKSYWQTMADLSGQNFRRLMELKTGGRK